MFIRNVGKYLIGIMFFVLIGCGSIPTQNKVTESEKIRKKLVEVHGFRFLNNINNIHDRKENSVYDFK